VDLSATHEAAAAPATRHRGARGAAGAPVESRRWAGAAGLLAAFACSQSTGGGAAAAVPGPAAPACASSPFGKIAAVTIQHSGAPVQALAFETKLAIDADGGRHAYREDDKGLDALANACPAHGRCWGIIDRPDGTRLRQKPPLDAYYVSSTSLHDGPEGQPGSYVDSETIAYLALPLKTLRKLAKSAGIDPFALRLGDLAYVRNRKNGRSAFAIFADTGPGGKIGEGSIALAEALQIPSSPRHGGAAGGIQFLVFPGSGDGKPRPQADIDREGRSRLQAWGGDARLTACLDAR
jgi:hypothetical protein